MIHYALRCAKGHEFEGWFKSGRAFDLQVKRKQLACAVCGSGKVEKAPMAPAISSRRVERQKAKAARMRQYLTELRAHVEASCDYVGTRFAEEARRMHYGETEPRSIYGEASDEQARELTDEGIEYDHLPWPKRTDS